MDPVTRPSKKAQREASRAARRAAEAERARKRAIARVAKRVTAGAVTLLIVAGVAYGVSGVISKPSSTTVVSSKSTSSSTTTTSLPWSKAQLASLNKEANTVAIAAGCPKSPTARVNTLSWAHAPAMLINPNGNYYAHFATTAGNFTVKLMAKAAPVSVNNFVFLANHGFYHCVIFHRVIPGFMIQGGDPTGTGTGGPGYTIKDEYPLKGTPTYPLYSLAMANRGAPHTGGSQFFIVTGPSGENLPNAYSLFGQVISGSAIVARIGQYGSASNNGTPPLVTERIINVVISNKP